MPEIDALVLWGLPGLFAASFLAGSVLPFPSEVVLAALVANGVNVDLAVAVATVGNTLGAITVWIMGGGAFLGIRKLAPELVTGPRIHWARERMVHYGAPLLLLSWLPVVGDPLVLAAGLSGVRPAPFLFWVVLGKAGRYYLVATGTLGAEELGLW